jgi:hypothetical protein
MNTLCALAIALLGTSASVSAVPDALPVPYLSWQDVKALYPPKHYPGDWDCPKLKSYPHEQELIQRCQQDLQLSLKVNPDPFSLGHKLWPGKLLLNCIAKDPENRVVYFVFAYDSDSQWGAPDLFVVYYYDPFQGRFILKSTR